MNRTAFSLPAHSQYRTRGGLEVSRAVEQFTGGASRLDDLIDLLDRRRGVVLSSGTTVPGRYESFDLGFSDPPLRLETVADGVLHGPDDRLQLPRVVGRADHEVVRDHDELVDIEDRDVRWRVKPFKVTQRTIAVGSDSDDLKAIAALHPVTQQFSPSGDCHQDEHPRSQSSTSRVPPDACSLGWPVGHTDPRWIPRRA